MRTPDLEHFERIHLRLDDLALEVMAAKQKVASLEVVILAIHNEMLKHGTLLHAPINRCPPC